MRALEYLSNILGDNKYILGDEPSEYDATVFGQLCVATWGLPDSIYEDVLTGKSKCYTINFLNNVGFYLYLAWYH